MPASAGTPKGPAAVDGLPVAPEPVVDAGAALLPALYLWLLRRRSHALLRVSDLGIARRASGRQWRPAQKPQSVKPFILGWLKESVRKSRV